MWKRCEMRGNSKLLAGALTVLLFFTAVPLMNLVFAESSLPLNLETVSDGNLSGGTVSDGNSGGGKTPGGEEESPEGGIQMDGGEFVQSVALLDSDGNEIAGEMSLKKRYLLRYEMISPLQIKLNDTDVILPPYMEKGIEYLLPGIPNDFCDFEGNIAVKAMNENGQIITVATIRIGADGIPVFIVEADLDQGRLLDGYFEVEVHLNRETIGDAEDFIFELPKGGSLEAEIAENKMQPPTVSKEAYEYDQDSKTVTWIITVQNADKTMKDIYPLIFSDVIGEGQIYVEGSFKAITPDNIAVEEFEVTDNQLIWQCSNALGGTTVQYEYQTKVDVMELLQNNLTNEDVNVTVQNVLSAEGADGSKVIEDLAASQDITEKSPVSIVKSVGETIYYSEEENTAEIEWTVTVTVNGYEIKDLTVYDYFDAGFSSVSLKGEPVCDPQPAANSRGYVPMAGSNHGKNYQWFYHIGDVSGNVAYTITYTTVIENFSEYVKRNNGISPKNQTWYDFVYPMGDGVQSKDFSGSVVTSNANQISANIVEKTGVYDPATHRVTWKVIVNPNQIQLPNAEIIDRIPTGQRYVESTVKIADAVPVATTVDEGNNLVSFRFGEDGLSGRTAIITLVTELEDSESGKWANNWSGRLENQVTLYADVLKEGGVSDTGTAFAKSQVITKDLGAFHYTDHTIQVTITINQNNMELTGAIVTDQLADYGLTLEDGGVQIDGIPLEEGTASDRPSYRYENGVLEIYPEEKLTQKTIITFTVQATDEYMYDHRSEAVIGFENTASLISEQYGEKVIARDTANMQNSPIVKSGTVMNQTGVISYKVEFNRTLADLPAGIMLTDTLPDGLMFRQSTVKLWLADVNDSTGVMTKTDREAEGYVFQVDMSGTDTMLEVSLPGGKQAYILEYEVQIVDKEKAPFVNRAMVAEYTGDGAARGSVSIDKIQVANARLENQIYIKVKKLDVYGNPLAGAVFSLNQGEKRLLLGATKEDGYLVFAGIEPNTEYTIVELRAPEGYVLFTQPWTFTTGTRGGVEYALEGIFVNQEEGWEQEGGEEETEPGNGSSEEETEPGNGSDEEETEPGNGSGEEETEPGNGSNGEEAEPGNGSGEEEAEPGNGSGEEETESGNGSNGEEAEPGGAGEDRKPDSENSGETKPGDDREKPGADSVETMSGEDNGETGAWDATLPPAQQEKLEIDRLPQTGGFWGSGLLYVIGAMMTGAGFMMWHNPKKTVSRWGRILMVVGISLIMCTLVLNLYTKWRNAREVAAFEEEILESEIIEPEMFPSEPKPPYPPNTMESSSFLSEEAQLPMTVQELQDENGVLAVLSIPVISCKEAVKEGCGSRVLAVALGHMEGTALPGHSGNCVIVGHRNYSFGLHLNRLGEVDAEDEITITTKEGAFTYTVTEIKVVEPKDLSVLEQTEEPRLTLITCTPIYIATHRLIVIAELRG